jgi:hypothetical protein
MLNESHPWKIELQQQLSDLNTAISEQNMLKEFDSIIFERPILFAAITMRKLIENRKITNFARTRQFPITQYITLPNASKNFQFALGRADLDRVFDMEKGQPAAIDLWSMCSEVIHSSYLVWGIDEQNKAVNFFVASARNQKSRLIAIDFRVFETAIQCVVDDRVESITTSYQDGKPKIVLS